MTNMEKSGLLRLRETEKYLKYIKEVLKVDSSMVDYTNFIPFAYDDVILKQMCDEEGIDMSYSSSYFVEGKYNPYMPLDKIVFSRKKVK